MNKEQKLLAYEAIAENVKDTTARQIVRYVLECELFNQDTVSPTNSYLSEKYKWSIETTKVAISLAKKSQFITTTGYGKSRCLEFNVSFLKGKMAEIYQKKIKPRIDFSDIVPNTLPNTLPNTFSDKYVLLEPQTAVFEGDNNNNNNNNKNNNPLTPFQGEPIKEIWNYYKTPPREVKVLNKTAVRNLLPECRKWTTDLEIEYKALLKKGYTYQDIEYAIKRYCTDIIGRDSTQGTYSSHRFSIMQFLKQKNGFINFVTK